VVEVASTEEPSAPPAGLDNDDDVVVNFYPYGAKSDTPTRWP